MPDRLTVFAKELRAGATDAERILWAQLRAKRLGGYKFRRQHRIGKYIVDFVCLERRVVIELDGGQHATPDGMEHDRVRDNWLKKEGYTVLRFWDNEVLQNIKGAIEIIMRSCWEHPPITSPPLQGEEVIGLPWEYLGCPFFWPSISFTGYRLSPV
jgi:very-short-patch-repair endonuclease